MNAPNGDAAAHDAPQDAPAPSLPGHNLSHLAHSLHGWTARCECGTPFGPGRRESVTHLHEQHVHVQEARAELEQGRRGQEG